MHSVRVSEKVSGVEFGPRGVKLRSQGPPRVPEGFPNWWADAVRDMKRPVIRMNKALYGHPEAGGHWERHLAKIATQMGGS